MSTEDPAVARSEEDGDDGSSDSRPGFGRWLLGLLITTVVLALVVKTFLLQAFYIPSTSMEPGLEVGDRILVEKVSTWVAAPERGDVVVFEDPGGWLGAADTDRGGVAAVLGAVGIYPEGGHLVKRVVGVAGDTIACCDDQGRLLRNGAPVEEGAYVRTEDLACAGPMTGSCAWTAGPVPDGEIFVMGDNRDASGDSTTHLCTDLETDCTADPFVENDLVVGTVLVTVWPFDRFGLVDDDPSSPDAAPGPPPAP